MYSKEGRAQKDEIAQNDEGREEALEDDVSKNSILEEKVQSDEEVQSSKKVESEEEFQLEVQSNKVQREEVQSEDVEGKYCWKHPRKRKLEKSLAKLWNAPTASFYGLDGSYPNDQSTYQKDHYLTKRPLQEYVDNAPHMSTAHGSTLKCSLLQWKYIHTPTPTPMDSRMKRYFRALSILEYEQDQGSLADTEFETSMVGNSCWIPSEKKRFFLALERCGQNNPKEIAQRVGPTKTLVEIMEYLKLLQSTSKGIGNLRVRHLTAREMSPIYILQEQIIAEQLQEKLQIESFGKHLEYLNDPQLDLLEIFNMSLLTRIFSGKPDMTVFSSTAINFHQLIKKLVSDIVLDLHTELLHTKDKIVTKDLMQLVLTKRQRAIEPDRRLKRVRVPGKFRRFKYYNNYPRVAKRKRAIFDEGDFIQKQRSDLIDSSDDDICSTASSISDSEEEVSELLNMRNLRPPPNSIAPKMNRILRNQHVVENLNQEYSEATNSTIENSIESDSSDEGESDYEEKEELELRKADAEHEEELIKYFEFYDEKTILNTRIKPSKIG